MNASTYFRRDRAWKPVQKGLPGQNTAFWPAAAVVLLLAMQATMVFTRAINWDEYFFFHQVTEFAGGTLTLPLQTIHVRLFGWLPDLFATSVDHIVVARVAMFGFELGTLACIFLLARKFSDQVVAAMTTLLYLSAGYVLQHGFSFRVDPMVTFALMAALAVLAHSRFSVWGVITFGLFAGIAGMISVKAVLYFPAFAGIALMRLDESNWSKDGIIRIAACALAAIISFAVFFMLHSHGLSDGRTSAAQGGTLLGNAAGWMFFIGVPPYWTMAVKSAMMAPLMYAAIVVSPFMLWRGKRSRHQKIGLIGLWMPLISIFFYTNTAAYFYVFVLAPVAVACVDAVRWAIDKYCAIVTASALVSIATGIWILEDRTTIDRQRQLEKNVYAIFAQPVTYMDHNYMLGAWPKANGFMTPWNMNRYRATGEPEYRAALLSNEVPLVLANWWTIRAMLDKKDDTLLVPDDNAAMRDNYVNISEFIWLAGKEFPAASGPLESEFLVPGIYTLESGSLTINGEQLVQGDTITISRGRHTILNANNEPARLVWGDNLAIPSDLLGPGPLYAGF